MQIFDYLNKDGLLHLIRKIMGRDVDLTQAEYDALPESKNSDGKNYYIYDSDITVTAEEVGFDGSASGSTAVNSQQALDELFAADKKTNESLENVNNNLKTLLKTEKIPFSGNYSQGTVTLVLSKDIGDYRIIALSDAYDYCGIFSINRWNIQTENTIRIMFNCKVDHDNNGYVNVLCIKK